MAENIGNDFATTLNGGINAAVTSLVVVSSTGAPSPNFRCVIESEIMVVTAVAGTTWTVTRGAESTAAATHADALTVAHVITKAGLDTYFSQRNAARVSMRV